MNFVTSMKRLSVGLLSGGLLFGLTSCNGNSGAVFGDVRYQVRCPRGLSGCSFSGDPLDVYAFNGTEGAFVSCSVVEEEDERLISFQVTQGTQSLQVSGLRVANSGGPARGSACTVTVRDESVTYTGACGGGSPSEAIPCQISEVEFSELDTAEISGPTVGMRVSCENITAPVDPTRFQRNVTHIDRADEAAPIQFVNCDGLSAP